jgi:methionine-rich copper-binding protein CopC
MTSKLSRCVVMVMTLTIAGLASRAAAHSFPQEQHPAAGQKLATSPSEIRIRFDAPIEKLFAKVQVLDAKGKDHAVGTPEVSANGIELSSKVETLPPGQYKVRWAVLCVDTHHTQGSYSFTVGGGGT